MSTLNELSDTLSNAVETASKYVVAVRGGTRFGASGVVWQPGVAVATRSSLRREDNLRISLPGGETVQASIAGHDPGTDLAVLRFEGESAIRGHATDGVKTGQLALAIGRSDKTGPNVALGVVSAVGQPWQTWQGGRIDQYIRLDVNLYPGGSGAAVLDASGGLIGIVSGSLSRIAPLAIPTATIERVAGQLIAKGTVSRPWLGVGVQPVAQGLVVLSVEPETPAGKAGLIVGDILLSVGGVAVKDPMNLRSALSQHAAGDTITVVLLRGGEQRELQVTLGEKAGRSR